MLDATQYELTINGHLEYDLYGNRFVAYEYDLVVDLVHWRTGVASSPEGLGRAIGDGIRDLAERYEGKSIKAKGS